MRQQVAVSVPSLRGSPWSERIEGEHTPIAQIVDARKGSGKGCRERDPARARRTGAGELAAGIGASRQRPGKITLARRRVCPGDQLIEIGERLKLVPFRECGVTASGPGRTWCEKGKDQQHDRSGSQPSQLLAGRKTHRTSAVTVRASVLMDPDPKTSTWIAAHRQSSEPARS